MTISLCMIVKNEETVLARCLESVKAAVDEIIIVDTGSTDATKRIAGLYTDKIYDFEWIDDFSAARNFAFSKATSDYQMWLDADDVMLPEDVEKLLQLKATLTPDVDMVTMKYITRADENGNATFESTRERLLKRTNGYRWIDPVHECIPLSGNIFYSDICVRHMQQEHDVISERNLKIYEALEQGGSQMTPRQQYYFARELCDHGRWAKAVYYFERFLSDGRGWYEDNIAACIGLGSCYQQLGENQKALTSLLRSFEYDTPHTEVCCELGYLYQRRGDYRSSLAWFNIALSVDEPEGAGFRTPDSSGYIPNIECCVCCSMLGDYERAKRYNEAAAVIRPDSDAVRHNREYLSQY